MKKIVIYASGSGSNAERLSTYFKANNICEVKAIFCNNPNAYVIERAKTLNINCILFNKEDFYTNNTILEKLTEINPDLIVLAGFLWLIPNKIISAFNDKIINIHPALLPKYGGKGMYGEFVHKAVINNKESESGITIHLVNEIYDEGKILSQKKCRILKNDTSETLAAKIHKLEHKWFPILIEQYLKSK